MVAVIVFLCSLPSCVLRLPQMHRQSLRVPFAAFLNGFSRPSGSISVLEFLVPSANSATSRTFGYSSAKRARISRQRASAYSTESGNLHRENELHAVGLNWSSESGRRDKVGARHDSQPVSETVPHSNVEDGKSSDTAKLVSKLDAYLPLELRSKAWLENLADFEGVRSVESLPALLQTAKSTIPRGLLHYVSVRQRRWECLLFLAKAMFSVRPPEEIDPFHILHQNSPWTKMLELHSLAEVSSMARSFEPAEPTPRHDPALKLLPSPALVESSDYSVEEYQAVMAEILECLGSLVLEAAKANLDESRRIMQYVHRIVADMHSQNVISPDIYKYDADIVPRARRKPPYLHAMSSRIMTVLSDSEWRANERDIIEYSGLTAAAYASRGQEMPGAELNPRVRPLLPGTWLEFVLWSCVHGGHFDEAARLIGALATKRRGPNWICLSWDELQRNAADRLAAKGESLTQSWLDKIAGAFEGYNEEPSVVEMPPYSISSEVAAATLEGLFSDLRGQESLEKAFKLPLSTYKRSLPKKMNAHQELFWNSLMTRFLESHTALVVSRSTFVSLPLPEDLLSSRPEKALHDSGHAKKLSEEFNESLHDPIHATLVQSFEKCVFDKDLGNSLNKFRRIQIWADINKVRAIQSFSLKASELEDESLESETCISDDIHMQISKPITASFLDLVVNANMFDLARWLLYSEDIDQEPMVPSSAIGSSTFQPALLRYALASSDYPLLIKITKELNTNLELLSPDILQALLACQIELGRWNHAVELLKYVRDERSLHLSAKDITVMACKYIRMEASKKNGKESEGKSSGIPEIRALLRATLNNGFVPPRDISQPPDYTPYRETNQLSCIFSTVDGPLGALALPFCVHHGPVSAPIAISIDAFNELLTELVKSQSPLAARKLFDRWCILPPRPQSPARTSHRSRGHSKEGNKAVLPYRAPFHHARRESIQDIVPDKTITPTLESIRIILGPATAELADFLTEKGAHRINDPSPEARVLLAWPTDSGGSSGSDHKTNNSASKQPAIVFLWSKGFKNLSSRVPNRKILEWGWKTYRRMGLDMEAIEREIPGLDLAQGIQ